MKKIITTVALSFGLMAHAQSTNDAFRGKNDLRLNIGANIQHTATGISASFDKGLGESFSLGIQAGYLLGIHQIEHIEHTQGKFEHRFDAKVRANANLGGVIGLPSQLDIYPGLNLGLKNFGAHIGARYFFGKGFGVFTEAQFPLARFNKNAESYRLWNNQFAMHLGVSFDISKK